MGEDFLIKNKRDKEETWLRLCSNDDLKKILQPACEELHLEILAHLGTLTWVSKDYEKALLQEMHIMDEWLQAHKDRSPRHKLTSERWSAIMQAIESQSFDDLELSF